MSNRGTYGDMPDRKKSILVAENHKPGELSLKAVVENESPGYDYVIAWTVSEARQILRTRKFDLLITDFMLEDGNAFDMLAIAGDIPVVVVEGSGDAEIAVKAMRHGVYDYLIKDPERNYLKILPLTIENAIKKKEYEKRILLLESAVTNASDAIVILEAEPGEYRGRKILYVNDAFTRMTGYTLEEITDKTLRILRGPKTDYLQLDRIRDALNNRLPVSVEIINYRKDGSEFWVECSIVPFADEKGEFVHWVSVQRDITERKKAEEEREKLMQDIEIMNANLTELNQELETIGAERTMSLMALTVADRIRNPSVMIGARCRRILAKQEITEELRKNLQYVIEEAEKLDTIVKEFEAFLKSRQSSFQYSDLGGIVESVVSVVGKEASYKGINMSVKISERPLNINMQKDLLRLALYHIIRNAVEATPPEGRITVIASGDSDTIVIAVSDTGPGIEHRDIENMFRPFFTTKPHGFGLGLPLVKQIVSEHLGNLQVESKKGEGTTFTILFPTRWKENKVSLNNS